MPSDVPECWGIMDALKHKDDEGSFWWQLRHTETAVDKHIKNAITSDSNGITSTSYPAYIANPNPGLVKSVAHASAGYHINGLPVENILYVNQHPDKKFTRLGKYGFLEITENLYNAICPCDLSGKICNFDETWVWDPTFHKWRGGCQMLRLCMALHKRPRPAAPPMTPFQYALHVPDTAHDALMKVQRSDPATIALFTPAAAETDQQYYLPLLATTASISTWPVLCHAGVNTHHPAHKESCCLLHDILITCFALLKDEKSSYHHDTPAFAEADCPHGHDFLSARRASAERRHDHRQAAKKIIKDGLGVRVQRERDGLVRVWVQVEGWKDWMDGTEGKYVFDGTVDERKAWDMQHSLGWCAVCNPAPPTIWVSGAVEEEAEEAKSDGEVTVVPAEQEKGRPVWEQEGGVEEGLMKKWSEKLAADRSK